MEARPLVQQLTVEADYSQIYVYDANESVEDAGVQTEDDNSLLRALDDAYESRRFVGYDAGVVDIVTPSQYNPHVPLELEIRDGPPPLDLDDWDHVVEVPLPAPSGTIAFEASGGGRPIEAKIPPGIYRARVSGRGFRSGAFEGGESFRLELWPAPKAEPKLVKYWPGFDENVEASD
jgi:hypothetical protein